MAEVDTPNSFASSLVEAPVLRAGRMPGMYRERISRTCSGESFAV